MLEYVFMDLDGTLTDPMIGITNSVMYALQRFGIVENDRRKLCRFIGPPLMESFMNDYGFSPSAAREALEIYREYFSVKGLYENAVYEGCEQFLKKIRKMGVPMAVASSKPQVYVQQILEHFGLHPYFSFIGGSDLEETRVKKADVLSFCISCVGNPNPRNCVMIGDRVHDVEGARAHGMKSVGVLYGYGSLNELQEANADYIVKDFNELHRVIVTIKNEMDDESNRAQK